MALPDSSVKRPRIPNSQTLAYSADSSMNDLVYQKPNPRAITLDSLPPCKVCGCVASGLHYGVVSCEACKSFFRRSLADKRKYLCRGKQQDGPCEVKNYKKCAFCRLQKCHEIGMSRGAIKVGRYTHAQRTLNIVQMKRHKHGVGGRMYGMSTPTRLVNSGVCHSPLNTHLRICPRLDEPVVESPALEESVLESHSLTDEQSDLIKTIVEANEEHNLLFHTFKDEKEISERQRQYYNHWLRKDELFGPMKAPSWKEFFSFYSITGLEMDERLRFTSLNRQQMDTLAKCAIKFAKAIPGFKDLSLKDQETLLKGGFFEFCNICAYRGIDPVLKVAIFVDGDIFCPKDMWSPAERVYINSLMEFAKRLHNLHITKEEDALLQAIVLTTPDRAELEQADRVEKLHWDIVWSLWNYLQQNHDAPSRTFSKIIDCLVDLRDLTECDKDFNRNIPFDIPELHASQLVCEFVDCPCWHVKQEPS